MQNIKKILSLLTPNELKQLGLLFVIILIMALLDVIGVASILPFMAVLTDPSLIETNKILNTLFKISTIFGVENNQEFFFALGVSVFVLLVTSLSFKAFTTYLQARFVQMREYSIAKRLIEGYLHQPYSWFLNRHTADLGKTILSEVQHIIIKGVSPLIDLIVNIIIIIFLITLLFIVEPKLTLTVSLSLCIIYGLIFYYFRLYVNKIGSDRLKNNEIRFLTVSEAFGAAKEIKVRDIEQNFVKTYAGCAKNYAKTQIFAQVIAQIPRFLLEAIAFGGILLIILYNIWQKGNFSNSLPIISLYVLAGYRLMPAIQKVYAALSNLSFISPSINKLHEDFNGLKPFKISQDYETLSINKNITLKNIHYSYPNSSKPSLIDINLNISARSTVAFVGTTGSGKTTIVDIILGLLEPQNGTLEIDGKIITANNSKFWRKLIGYVPQQIYLSDDTVAANIAFGVEPKNIDIEKVEKASKIANLHDFVKEKLPKEYNSMIGERGVRLSGGQRQRIGIARALYHEPQVLILDEATSALDNQTEQAVMEAVNKVRKDLTIIQIAHRLSTVKNCDTIFLLDQGRLNDKGNFKELVKNNDQFRNNANIY